MSAISDLLENRLIDALLRGQSLALGANLYLGLGIASGPAPAEATMFMPGGSVQEVVGSGYARVAVPRSLTGWSGTNSPSSTAPSTGTSATTYLLQNAVFPRCTGPWGTVTHIGVFDAAVGGHLLLYAKCLAPTPTGAGVLVKFLGGSLAFSLAQGVVSFAAPANALLLVTQPILLGDSYLVL